MISDKCLKIQGKKKKRRRPVKKGKTYICVCTVSHFSHVQLFVTPSPTLNSTGWFWQLQQTKHSRPTSDVRDSSELDNFYFIFFLIFQTLHNCISFEKYVTPWTISQPGSFCPWVSPGMRTGGGCHILLQGIFPTQGSNPHLLQLLHRQAGSFTTSTNCLKPQN